MSHITKKSGTTGIKSPCIESSCIPPVNMPCSSVLCTPKKEIIELEKRQRGMSEISKVMEQGLKSLGKFSMDRRRMQSRFTDFWRRWIVWMYHYWCVPTWGAQQGCLESMVRQIEESLSLCHLFSLREVSWKRLLLKGKREILHFQTEKSLTSATLKPWDLCNTENT